MNNDHYQRLSEITGQLLKMCDSVNQKRDFATAAKLIPITSNLAVLLSEIVGEPEGKHRHLTLVRR